MTYIPNPFAILLSYSKFHIDIFLVEVIHILVGDSEEKILIIVCAANILGSPDLLYIGAHSLILWSVSHGL